MVDKLTAEGERTAGLVGRTAAFNIATSLLAAFTGILIARWLGPSGRGNYAAVTAYLGTILVLTELGIASAVVFHVSRFRASADSYVRTALALFLPLTATALVVTVAITLAGLDSDDPRQVPLLVVTACITATMLGAPASFALQSLSIFRWNIMRISQPIVMMILLLGWMIWESLTVTAIIALMAVSFAVQTAIGWAAYKAQGVAAGRVDPSKVAPMVRYGLANVASTAPNAINARFDQLVLAVLVAPAALGQYAVAVSLSLLAGPLALAFGNVAFPHLAGGGDASVTIRKSVRGAFAVTIAGVVLITACSPLVVPPVFGTGYEAVPKLLVILAPGAILFVVNQVIGDVLRGLGRPGLVARCEWTGLVLTLVGLFVFVPMFGAYGAAWVSSIAYTMVHLMLQLALRQSASRVGD